MRAANAWGNGGSDTISIDQMPSHTHTVTAMWTRDAGPGDKQLQFGNGGATITYDNVHTTTSTGGGQPFYPTYQDVYAWTRTA